MRGALKTKIKQLVSVWAILTLACLLPATAQACPEVKYVSCACPADCDQTYCEQIAELVSVTVHPQTRQIICNYYYQACGCGAIAFAPENPWIRLTNALLGVRNLRAADRKPSDAKVPDPSGPREITVENAHGKFSTIIHDADSEIAHTAGIGVRLNIVDKELTIVDVSKEGPAADAKLKKGDIIEYVDGMIMRGLGLKDAVTLMRGKPGTLVVLKVRKKGEKKLTKVALLREFLRYYENGAPRPRITVEEMTKPENERVCPPMKNECLFLNEVSRQCYYTCRSEPSTQPPAGKRR